MKNLKIGIVGLPNVGKSSLFNSLTKNDILVANYPFATIEPNTGIVSVPDYRLLKLKELYNSEKIVPAIVEFFDIAGLVKGASEGEGLGNKFLSHIRETSLIIHVVRVFKDSNVTHVMNGVNPKKDIEIINTELVLADLESLVKQMTKIEKDAKSNPKDKDFFEHCKYLKTILEKNQPIWEVQDNNPEFTKKLSLLTSKPVIYVFNLDETNLTNSKLKSELQEIVEPSRSLFLSAKLENELKNLSEEEQIELLSMYGQTESGLNKLTTTAYDYLNLQSFLTAGKKEVRAWTIAKGTTAPKAAGEIHGDIERGFIAAEIISFDEMMKFETYQDAKRAGKVRLEGKSYIMKNDDIVDFKFNV